MTKKEFKNLSPIELTRLIADFQKQGIQALFPYPGNCSTLKEFKKLLSKLKPVRRKKMTNRSTGKPYSEKALQLIEDLYETYPTQKLANRLGRTKEAVRKQANRMGLVKTKD